MQFLRNNSVWKPNPVRLSKPVTSGSKTLASGRRSDHSGGFSLSSITQGTFGQTKLLTPKGAFSLHANTLCLQVGERKSNAAQKNNQIKALLDEQKFEEAVTIFQEMKKEGISGDEIAYDSALKAMALSKEKKIEEILALLSEMKEHGIKSNLQTFHTVIETVGNAGAADKLLQVFELMKELQVIPNESTYALFLGGLAKKLKTDEMSKIFQAMKDSGMKPDLGIYEIMLDAFGKKQGQTAMARLFSEMTAAGVQPTIGTMHLMIEGFGRLGMLNEIEVWFSKLKELGFTPVHDSYHGMLDCYSKRGQKDKMLTMFQLMKDKGVTPNVATYALMVEGMQRSGDINKAFMMFDEMRNLGLKPTYHTFYNLIEACGNHNQMQRIPHVRKLMEEDENMPPDSKFLATLVEAHTKNHQIPEAIQIIEEITKNKFELVVWMCTVFLKLWRSRAVALDQRYNHQQLLLRLSLKKKEEHLDASEANMFLRFAENLKIHPVPPSPPPRR